MTDQHSQEGITAISVRGFKSLARESRIEIRPLTILAGANSSGKSSIVQPLLLMKQTLEAMYDPGPLLLNGPNVQFTSFDQFISHSQKNSKCREFSVKIEATSGAIEVTFSIASDQTLEIREMIIESEDHKIRLQPNQDINNDEIENLLRKPLPATLADYEPIMEVLKSCKWIVIRNRCFLDIFFEAPADMKELVLSILRTPIFSFSYWQDLSNIIHVPGVRDNPERVYNRAAIGPNFAGIFEKYVAGIIAHWEAEKDVRLNALWEMLAVLGLTRKITAKAVHDTQIELMVGRLPNAEHTDDIVSIADVGFGVSQVLPVLVALLVARSGQFVYLEQPELHLHPRAQRALAAILAQTAARGVKVVVETHSALLLRAVQTLVAKEKIAPELVKLHWFARDSKDGTTAIKSADMDQNGAFGDWPEDFDDVALAVEGAYLDAVAERNKNGSFASSGG